MARSACSICRCVAVADWAAAVAAEDAGRGDAGDDGRVKAIAGADPAWTRGLAGTCAGRLDGADRRRMILLRKKEYADVTSNCSF